MNEIKIEEKKMLHVFLSAYSCCLVHPIFNAPSVTKINTKSLILILLNLDAYNLGCYMFESVRCLSLVEYLFLLYQLFMRVALCL